MNHADKRKALKILNEINDLVLNGNAETQSLFGGELTKTFYFLYLFEYSRKKEHAEIALENFERVLTLFNKGDARLYGPYLCNGLTGLLYVILLFIKKGLIKNYQKEEIEPLIEHLTEAAIIGIENDNNDFIHGSFGTLYAVAEFGKLFNNHKYLRELLCKIENKYYQSQKLWIPCGQDEESTVHKINLSLSHGQYGLLLTLFYTHNILGLKEDKAQPLSSMVDYIIELRKDFPYNKTYNYFPSIIDTRDNSMVASNRLAWCYGDLGSALFLNHASSFFKKQSYANIANEVGIKTTLRRSYEETYISNAYLCHGSSGVAHLYRILHEITGMPEYEKSYSYWIEETIRLSEKILSVPVEEKLILNLAEGIPGIGLVLMSFLSSKKHDWGKVMLMY